MLEQTITQLRQLKLTGMADAILDRLMHNAHRLKLKGESMRKTRSSLTDGEHLG